MSFDHPDMSRPECMIDAHGLGKCYHIYSKPSHRLMQALVGHRRKLYREFWALRGVDLQLSRGETLGIIGRNGSGKSTLLQLIAGTLAATEGAIQVRGRVAALLELGSGFNPEFTGRENVFLNAAILGLTQEQINERMAAILEFAEIDDFIDQPVKSYSSGMVMRLAFSVMVHVDAEVLIIDEALAVGDAYFTQKCMRFLREFKSRGTLLFVSHDSAAVAGLCDRAIWLDAGQVRATGSAKDVVGAYLEAFIAAREGKDVAQPVEEVGSSMVGGRPRRDIRKGDFDRSQLRNDMEVFEFDSSPNGFGNQNARVIDVALLDESGRQLPLVIGGESVLLEVVFKVEKTFDEPIVGFYFKDRLGQELFGDNTYLTYAGQSRQLAPGDVLRARFGFEMPRLAAGDYHFTVGLASGNQHEHVIVHWIHEALHVKAQGQGVPRGILGLPMYRISIEEVVR